MNKILIVDDSRMILQVAKDMIVNNIEEVEVVIESDSKKVKKLIKDNHYHVIILDIIMPDITGIDLLKWIRSKSSFDNLKIIMFTSLNDTGALADCFALGAYDFITKPLDEVEFLARIRRARNEYKLTERLLQNYQVISQSKKDLEQSNVDLKATQSQLIQSEKLAGIGYLAAGMAHEINNPLGYISSNVTTLKGNVSMILYLYKNLKLQLENRENLEHIVENLLKMEEEIGLDFILEDSEDVFEDINNGLARIKKIVEALRSFSQIDSTHEKEPLDIEEIIQGNITLLASKFEGKVKVAIDLDISNLVYGSKSEVNMSLMSIITNAYDAIISRESITSGHLNIRGCERPGWIVLEIEDDGVGMNPEVLRHALDPFYTTKAVGVGTGLGLSTAYNCFVNVMKGELKLDSTKNEGSKITIELPIGKQE